MTHWRKIVSKDSPNLNVWDIEGRSPVVVTIACHEVKMVHNEDNEPKDMLFLRFKGAKKALGINVTNATLIAAQHGPDVEQWIGKRITLRTATCRGEDCVRVGVPAGLKLPRRLPRFRYTDNDLPNRSEREPLPPSAMDEPPADWVQEGDKKDGLLI